MGFLSLKPFAEIKILILPIWNHNPQVPNTTDMQNGLIMHGIKQLIPDFRWVFTQKIRALINIRIQEEANCRKGKVDTHNI